MKVNSYMEMENEFEELKEKVKYQGGEFLNNERKDNEIIILRQENNSRAQLALRLWKNLSTSHMLAISP